MAQHDGHFVWLYSGRAAAFWKDFTFRVTPSDTFHSNELQ